MKRRNVLALFCAVVFFQAFMLDAQAKTIIKTGAQENLPKYFLVNNVMSGLCVDIIKAIEKADPSIQFSGYEEFVPFTRIIGQLDNGGYDAFVGLVKNPERLEKYVFVEPPIYTLKHAIAVRADDPVKVRTIDDIVALGKDGIVMTNTGVAHIAYLQDKGKGKLTIDSTGATFEQNFKKLVQNRGRFFYLNDAELKANLAEFAERDKVKILPIEADSFPHFIAFSRKAPQASVDKVTKALVLLKEKGELDRIFAKYK